MLRVSRDNVELVKAAHPQSGADLTKLLADGLQSQDRLDAVAALFHPEFTFSGALIGGPEDREEGTGLANLMVRWREWMEPWEVYWTEVEDIVDARDNQVLVKVRDHGRLRGADQEVRHLGASIWTIEARKIVRIDFYLDRRQAMEAVGLRG
jgi:ketosteroid isomerase-like protein